MMEGWYGNGALGTAVDLVHSTVNKKYSSSMGSTDSVRPFTPA